MVSGFAVCCSCPLWLALIGAPPHEEGSDTDLACAPRAICLAMQIFGSGPSNAEIRDAFGGRVSGLHSYDELTGAVESLGLSGRLVSMDPASPRLARLPLIAAVKRSSASSELDHFVVLYGSGNGYVQVLDFPYPPRLVPCSALSEIWDGRGLYVATDQADLPSREPIWGAAALAGAAGLVAVLSLMIWVRARKVAPRNAPARSSRASGGGR